LLRGVALSGRNLARLLFAIDGSDAFASCIDGGASVGLSVRPMAHTQNQIGL
jgi:hypothetical protein